MTARERVVAWVRRHPLLVAALSGAVMLAAAWGWIDEATADWLLAILSGAG